MQGNLAELERGKGRVRVGGETKGEWELVPVLPWGACGQFAV